MKNNYFEIRDMLVTAIGGPISTASQSSAISSLARLLAGLAQGRVIPTDEELAEGMRQAMKLIEPPAELVDQIEPAPTPEPTITLAQRITLEEYAKASPYMTVGEVEGRVRKRLKEGDF